MDKLNKTYLIFIAAVVLVVAGVWLFSAKHSNKEENSTYQPNSQQASTTPKAEVQTGSSGQNSWTGTLANSDNQSKGNLMLVMPEGTIYIHTERDFSSLIGKTVNVSYEGSRQNFVLGNITPAEPQ